MSSVLVRFFGRFVFAEPLKAGQPTGELNVLAVNMEHNTDVNSDSHDFLMTSARARVAVPGSRRPDLNVMSTAGSTDRDAELAVWNLRDYEVVIAGSRNFSWADRSKLADLATLTGNTARFNTDNLRTAGLFSPVHAQVRFATGRGTALQMDPAQTVSFVQVDRTPSGIKDVAVADVVEVAITLPKDEKMMTFHLRNRSGGPASSIVVAGDEDAAPTVVNFSNLCRSGHGHRTFDDEFANFYEVLQNPGVLRHRLIPARTATEGLEFDCFFPSYIQYEV
jgi:hypothetical protein